VGRKRGVFGFGVSSPPFDNLLAPRDTDLTVFVIGVSNPVTSSYHRSRLSGGLEAARAAKEIAHFETNKQILAPPPPYTDDTVNRRLSMLRRDQQTHHDDGVLKRELAEELRRDFDEKADPATRACEHNLLLSYIIPLSLILKISSDVVAVYEALSKLKEREVEKRGQRRSSRTCADWNASTR